MNETIQDARGDHWVYRMPERWIPYLQLSRLDRPIGYWLLALPGWIALAFASLSQGLAWSDLKWAALVLIGAVAMRGAGCTYNDIVDRELDAQVARTALRPIPAGTITLKKAWVWLAAQCFIGLLVLLAMPRLAQIIALCSLPLVAAYPFMKRITWWPQVWLGMTFNWAALVAYAAKTDTINGAIGLLYLGLIFWTIGYDTIYACQDIEDDAFVGIKSTARRFGKRVKLGVGLSYLGFLMVSLLAIFTEPFGNTDRVETLFLNRDELKIPYYFLTLTTVFPSAILLTQTVIRFDPSNGASCLSLFKKNAWVAIALIAGLLLWQFLFGYMYEVFVD